MAVRTIAATLLLLATPALARTDLAGCTYTDSVVQASGEPPYATRVWYVPGTGEICAFLDCGGGMAPPMTTVPGCPLYSGTATYSPSYLDLQTTEATSGAASTTAAQAEQTSTTVAAAAAPLTTLAPSVTPAASTARVSASISASVSALASASASASAPFSSSPSSHSNGSTGSTTPAISPIVNGAAVPAAAAGILGACLIAGVAACVGMM